MTLAEFGAIPGAPTLPAGLTEGPMAVEQYVANLIQSAANGERNNEAITTNNFAWSVPESGRFRGTVQVDATVNFG